MTSKKLSRAFAQLDLDPRNIDLAIRKITWRVETQHGAPRNGLCETQLRNDETGTRVVVMTD